MIGKVMIDCNRGNGVVPILCVCSSSIPSRFPYQVPCRGLQYQRFPRGLCMIRALDGMGPPGDL